MVSAARENRLLSNSVAAFTATNRIRMAIGGLATCGRDLFQQWQLPDLIVGLPSKRSRVSK
jgi:hypothetical protein